MGDRWKRIGGHMVGMGWVWGGYGVGMGWVWGGREGCGHDAWVWGLGMGLGYGAWVWGFRMGWVWAKASCLPTLSFKSLMGTMRTWAQQRAAAHASSSSVGLVAALYVSGISSTRCPPSSARTALQNVIFCIGGGGGGGLGGGRGRLRTRWSSSPIACEHGGIVRAALHVRARPLV